MNFGDEDEQAHRIEAAEAQRARDRGLLGEVERVTNERDRILEAVGRVVFPDMNAEPGRKVYPLVETAIGEIARLGQRLTDALTLLEGERAAVASLRAELERLEAERDDFKRFHDELADRAQRARDRGAYDVEGALLAAREVAKPATAPPSSSAKSFPLHELGTTEPPAPATCTGDGAVARRPPATFGEKVLAFGLAEPSGIMGDAFARAAGREPCATCGAPHPPPPPLPTKAELELLEAKHALNASRPAPVRPAPFSAWPKGSPICTCVARAWTHDAGAWCVPCTACGGLRPAPRPAITYFPFAGRREVFARIADEARAKTEYHQRPPHLAHDSTFARAFELLEELARELAGKETK